MMDDFSRITEFHGHAGIWVGIGYKAGQYAKEILNPEKHKEMLSKVSILYEIPYSCILDGIQISSGCTLGKKNIEIIGKKENPEIEFLNIKTGKRIFLKIKEEILKEIENKKSQKNSSDEEELRWILGLGFDELFERMD